MIRGRVVHAYLGPMLCWDSHGPVPAGALGLRAGPAFAATDSLRVTLTGAGGHGSRPEATVDPVVMAAATVMRLQTIVSREVAGTDTAVVTVGASRAGTKANIIPEQAELLLNVRTYDPHVRATVLNAITRIVEAEADAAGAPVRPVIESIESAPAVINDPAASRRTQGLRSRSSGPDGWSIPGR